MIKYAGKRLQGTAVLLAALFGMVLLASPAEGVDVTPSPCGYHDCPKNGPGFDVGSGVTVPGVTAPPHSPGAGGGGPQGQYIEHAYTPACDGNSPGNVVDSGCTRATTGCGDNEIRSWVWTRTVTPPAPPPGYGLPGALVCRSKTAPEVEEPRASPEQIYEAYRHLPVTRAEVNVQPTHRTLVGLPTVFYARIEDHLSWPDVKVAGEAIDFIATAEKYIWHFGDDTELVTTDPGKPYPNQTVTHKYTKSGATASPYVTVVWAGKYRHHDETTWREVPDRVEADGPAVTVEVASAGSELVSGED